MGTPTPLCHTGSDLCPVILVAALLSDQAALHFSTGLRQQVRYQHPAVVHSTVQVQRFHAVGLSGGVGVLQRLGDDEA
jgi:hypothetical protein